MSANLQHIIQEQVRALSEDEMRRVLNFVNDLREEKKSSQAKPISAIFEELSGEIPLEEWRNLPACCRALLSPPASAPVSQARRNITSKAESI